MAGRDWLRHGDVYKILGANPVMTFRPSGSSMFSLSVSPSASKPSSSSLQVLFSFY